MAPARRRGGRGSERRLRRGAGVIWALHELGSTGWEDAALAFIDRQRARPPLDEFTVETSYSFGELGINLVAYRLTGDAGVADRVHDLVLAQPGSETNEMMVGTPGSMLAAEAMLAWTGDQRWDNAWNAASERVEAARDPDGLWTQHPARRRSATSARRTAMPGTCGHSPTGDERPSLRTSSRTFSARTGSRTGSTMRVRALTRFACSGATARRGWWRRSATCSTRARRRRRRADVARRTAREGTRPLPRHCRQRVRLPRPPPPDGRPVLARPGARLRAARDRPGRAGACDGRPRPLLALHGRHRRRALPPAPIHGEERFPTSMGPFETA